MKVRRSLRNAGRVLRFVERRGWRLHRAGTAAVGLAMLWIAGVVAVRLVKSRARRSGFGRNEAARPVPRAGVRAL